MGKGPDKVVNFGAIQVSIWSNDYKGTTNYSAKLSKRFKKDNKWENTDFLNKNDILIAAAALQEAFKGIIELQTGTKDTNNSDDNNDL